jgi:hypothetical protein
MSTQDIFGRKSASFGGSFSADDAILSFAGTGINTQTNSDIPLLVQQFQVSYQQTTSMLFDLTSEKVFFVRGRAQGEGGMDQIIGPVKLASLFLRNYGDVCQIDKNTFTVSFKARCDSEDSTASTNTQQTLQLSYVLFNRIAFSGTAQNMLFTTQAGFMFADLKDTTSQNLALPNPTPITPGQG